MKNLNLILFIALLSAFIMPNTTTFAQEGTELQSVKQGKKALKAQNKKGAKIIPQNKLTPAQKKALQQKRIKQGKLTPAQKAQRDEARLKKAKAKPVKPSSPGAKLQKLTPQRKGTPISKTGVKNRTKDINKAKAIAKVNLGSGRAKAGDSKLAKAKAKLKTMKASGKYTDAQIKHKELILAKYEEQLMRLKTSVEKGNASVRQ